jgi:hypothetical protein
MVVRFSFSEVLPASLSLHATPHRTIKQLKRIVLRPKYFNDEFINR